MGSLQPKAKHGRKGTVRFNPNLYAEGKVCLTLLGTWPGQESEKWIPGTSSLYQVAVSIQSLIMVDRPYFNEPGYEADMNTEKGKTASDKYNDTIRLGTLNWAILDMLKNPPEIFKKVIVNHFKCKKKEVMKIAKKWRDEAPAITKQKYVAIVNELRKELKKL